jgi:hypothetical protein
MPRDQPKPPPKSLKPKTLKPRAIEQALRRNGMSHRQLLDSARRQEVASILRCDNLQRQIWGKLERYRHHRRNARYKAGFGDNKERVEKEKELKVCLPGQQNLRHSRPPVPDADRATNRRSTRHKPPPSITSSVSKSTGS